MEQKALINQAKTVGGTVVGTTYQAMFEFLRAVTTLVVGGLFMFYSYVALVGVSQSFQNGAFIQSFGMVFIFVVAFGAFIGYVALINGKLPSE